jgi:hypothetical protein
LHVIPAVNNLDVVTDTIIHVFCVRTQLCRIRECHSATSMHLVSKLKTLVIIQHQELAIVRLEVFIGAYLMFTVFYLYRRVAKTLVEVANRK